MKAKLLFTLLSVLLVFKKFFAADSLGVVSVHKLDSLILQSKLLKEKIAENNLPHWTTYLIVLAALVGPWVAFSASRFAAKANSLSQFRVKWIGELRDAFCECTTALREVCLKANYLRNEGSPFNLSGDENWDKFQHSKTKINLLLHHDPNPKSDDHGHLKFWRDFESFIEKSQKTYFKTSIPQEEELIVLKNKQEKLEEQLREILRKEWLKTKKFK